jgi:tyrosyl-tRNA synthetase
MDSPETIAKKVKSADFVAGNTDNGTMAFFEHVVFVLLGDKGKKLVIERPKKFGGDLNFSNYGELKEAVEKESVHPLDVKNAAVVFITDLLSEIEGKRNELEKIARLAYP